MLSIIFCCRVEAHVLSLQNPQIVIMPRVETRSADASKPIGSIGNARGLEFLGIATFRTIRRKRRQLQSIVAEHEVFQRTSGDKAGNRLHRPSWKSEEEKMESQLLLLLLGSHVTLKSTRSMRPHCCIPCWFDHIEILYSEHCNKYIHHAEERY